MTVDSGPTAGDPFPMHAATIVDILERASALRWEARGIGEFESFLALIDEAARTRDAEALADLAVSLGVLLTFAGERYAGRAVAEPSPEPPRPTFPRQRVNELVDRLRVGSERPARKSD